MGIIIDKITGNPLLVEVKEADLTTALQSKVNTGKIAGTFSTVLPTGTIATDKIYDFVGTDNTSIGGITWRNGDSAYYNGSIWIRIPFQSLSNYYQKTETKALPDSYMSNSELIEAANGEDYEVLVPTYDANGNVSSATVKWRDGATGVIAITRDVNYLVASYTITHVLAGETTRTVTQSTVTRNAECQITNKPALTVA